MLCSPLTLAFSSCRKPVENEEGRPESRPPEVDQAIIDALLQGPGSFERRTVGDMEEIVVAFISDTSRDILEFPSNLGAYPKMVAHRVAQAYGLMTSTVDYEEGPGRVVGTRTQQTCIRETRLIKMDLSQYSSVDHPSVSSSSGNVTAPRLLLRPNASDPNQSSGSKKDVAGESKGSLTLAEREEEYNRARERIIGTLELPQESPSGEPTPESSSSPAPQPSSTIPVGPSSREESSVQGAAGGGGGRGERGRGRGGRFDDGGGRGGGGRGRRAVFRDRDRDMEDPDYTRRDGYSNPQMGYDVHQQQLMGYYMNPEAAHYANYQQAQQQQYWGMPMPMPMQMQMPAPHFAANPMGVPPPPNPSHYPPQHVGNGAPPPIHSMSAFPDLVPNSTAFMQPGPPMAMMMMTGPGPGPGGPSPGFMPYPMMPFSPQGGGGGGSNPYQPHGHGMIPPPPQYYQPMQPQPPPPHVHHNQQYQPPPSPNQK